MLRDYNNYVRDKRNWDRAYAAQSAMQDLNTRAHNQNLKAEKDLRSGQPGMLGSRGTLLGAISDMHRQITPLEQMANQHQMNMQNAAAHAMNNEMAQVQDRKMDLADNEQGRKNLDTEYNRQIEMERLSAAERMNERNNQGLDSLSNSFSSMGNGFISDPMQVPDYDLYDKNRRIGGFFGEALLG
jgi:hypothetical protein